MSSAMEGLEARFGRACGLLFDRLAPGEEMSLEFSAEAGEFMRFTKGRVRQVGSVSQSGVRFSYYHDGRTMGSAFEMTGEDPVDRERAAAALETARREARLLPADPYQVLPTASETSREVFTGKLPDPAAIPVEVLGPAAAVAGAGAEFVGIHSQGAVCRGAANSRGARHWFATETFITDYSAWHANGKALKSSYAGREWDRAEYARRLEASRPRLEVLAHPEKIVAPGAYTVYIAPDALNEFVPFFSWNGLGERGMREGESAWRALRDGRRTMSTLFSVHQDFGTGVEPRFNELGEVAPAKLTLVDKGRLAATLVSSRTAKQYGVASNAAPEDEHARSLAIEPGTLDEAAAVEAIGTGLFLSNLHYLNWSDNDSGRITGMTRFACFWVEGGKVSAPIRDMRFDESIYNLFGDKLQALSRERSLVPDTGTYMRRSLGGALLPGLLVRDFTFTL